MSHLFWLLTVSMQANTHTHTAHWQWWWKETKLGQLFIVYWMWSNTKGINLHTTNLNTTNIECSEVNISNVLFYLFSLLFIEFHFIWTNAFLFSDKRHFVSHTWASLEQLKIVTLRCFTKDFHLNLRIALETELIDVDENGVSMVH